MEDMGKAIEILDKLKFPQSISWYQSYFPISRPNSITDAIYLIFFFLSSLLSLLEKQRHMFLKFVCALNIKIIKLKCLRK